MQSYAAGGRYAYVEKVDYRIIQTPQRWKYFRLPSNQLVMGRNGCLDHFVLERMCSGCARILAENRFSLFIFSFCKVNNTCAIYTLQNFDKFLNESVPVINRGRCCMIFLFFAIGAPVL